MYCLEANLEVYAHRLALINEARVRLGALCGADCDSRQSGARFAPPYPC